MLYLRLSHPTRVRCCCCGLMAIAAFFLLYDDILSSILIGVDNGVLHAVVCIQRRGQEMRALLLTGEDVLSRGPSGLLAMIVVVSFFCRRHGRIGLFVRVIVGCRFYIFLAELVVHQQQEEHRETNK